MRSLTRKLCRLGSGILAGLLLCAMLNTASHPAIATDVRSPSPLQPGLERYQAGQFNDAIALWQSVLTQSLDVKTRAQIYAYIAQAYRQIGKLDQAIANWQEAIKIYQAQKNDPDSARSLAATLTQQAQAYSAIGQHQNAIDLAKSALSLARQNQDQMTVIVAQGTLGNAYRRSGDYDQALAAHQASLKLAQELNQPVYISTALNNLGNVYVSRSERYLYQAGVAASEDSEVEETQFRQLADQDGMAAMQAYEQSLANSRSISGIAQAKALLNINRLLVKSNASDVRAEQNRAQIVRLLKPEPDSQDKAFALINLVISSPNLPQIEALALLQDAIEISKRIKDQRAESYALGTLGQIYESNRQYAKALDLSHQAQLAAQEIRAADSLYRWQWQTGRILKATGDTQAAIKTYKQAIATLQTIRGDIVAAARDLQFDFRDSVEPIYRELIALLLTNPEPQATKTQFKPQVITQALDVLELLKLAELQNFFGDDCVQIVRTQQPAEQVDRTAAIVYSVILDDRTAMILRLPDGSLTLYPLAIGAKALQTEIDQLRQDLENQTTEEYLIRAEKVYNLLIRPMADTLAAANPKTLVFVQDGVLRKVPMAALYDGQKFLIEKYAIANTPSLSLTNLQAPPNRTLTALAGGLTLERPPFAPLPSVRDEITEVQRILGGTTLINQTFTLTQLEERLRQNDYSVIHMATHGKFGTDADSTFLLTYNEQVSIEQLDRLLRSRKSREPVELLTMSACQTAAGDNRSALGIAGIAVRAGVKSALASLWYINDAATVPLIEEFYTQLRNPNVTKAEALRQAQLKFIGDRDYNHPAFWSPFILIGSWL